MKALVLLAFLVGLMPEASAQAAAPRVVVSIKPVHSLVAAVMAGIGEPSVLIKGSASPHTYSLKPSDARLLADADLVIWVGPSVENFLETPLSVVANKATVITLTATPGIKLLKARHGGVWEPHLDDPQASTGESDLDGHLWLDPENAQAIVTAVAAVLDKRDPANASRYDANAAATSHRLTVLDAEIGRELEPVKTKPFIVFHDAYQYLQIRYGLNAVGAITVDPGREPGARRLTEIRHKISALGPTCIFAEPQFRPRLLESLAAESGVRTGTLDPEGTALPQGPDLYFLLMRALADNLRMCLAPS